LHERGQSVTGQYAIQTVITSIWILLASPIANAITPEWWYLLGAFLACALFVVAIFLLPETKYVRPLTSYQDFTTAGSPMVANDLEGDVDEVERAPIVCTSKPPLDFDRYAPRTWRSDMRLWVGKPEWNKGLLVYKVSQS